MSKYSIEDTTLTAIGDALREKEGSADPIPVTDIASRIEALSVGEEGKYLTPEEVYAAYRDPTWPVLPDPEPGETYALIRTYWNSSQTALQVTLPAKESASDRVDIGYINSEGDFVIVAENETPGSVYWAKFGLTGENVDAIYPYAVLRMQDNQNMTTSTKVTSSSNSTSNNSGSGYVLEMKINSDNAAYFSAAGDYPATYPNLEFITFYNTSFQPALALSFSGLARLKTVVFKGYNPMIDPSFAPTGSWGKLFYGCYNLLACYPLKCAIQQGQNMLTALYSLPKIEMDFTECTTAPGIPILTGVANGICYALRELSIINPFSSNSTIISSSNPSQSTGLRITALNCPQCSASTTSLPPHLTELLNVDYKFNMSSSSPANGMLKRITMAPTMTRSCGTMRIKSYVMTKEDVQEWFESLPVLNGETATLVLTDIISLTNHDIDDIIAIATEKGYTVTR